LRGWKWSREETQCLLGADWRGTYCRYCASCALLSLYVGWFDGRICIGGRFKRFALPLAGLHMRRIILTLCNTTNTHVASKIKTQRRREQYCTPFDGFCVTQECKLVICFIPYMPHLSALPSSPARLNVCRAEHLEGQMTPLATLTRTTPRA
jgi:hypothetical protein